MSILKVRSLREFVAAGANLLLLPDHVYFIITRSPWTQEAAVGVEEGDLTVLAEKLGEKVNLENFPLLLLCNRLICKFSCSFFKIGCLLVLFGAAHKGL